MPPNASKQIWAQASVSAGTASRIVTCPGAVEAACVIAGLLPPKPPESSPRLCERIAPVCHTCRLYAPLRTECQRLGVNHRSAFLLVLAAAALAGGCGSEGSTTDSSGVS